MMTLHTKYMIAAFAFPRFRRWATRLLALLSFLSFFLISKAATGQDSVEAIVGKFEVVSISLPKLKTQLKPLDENVSVALHFSMPQDPAACLVRFGANNPGADNRWYAAERVKAASNNNTTITAEPFVIAVTTPAVERTAEIIKGFFPRTNLYREGSAAGSEELQLWAKITPELIEGGEVGLKNLTVRISLAVTDQDGHQIALIEANSNNVRKAHFFWTIKNAWATLAKDALNEACDALIRAIPANKPLKARLHELAQDRDLPASIATTARFKDDTGLLPNGKLDAGEAGILLVQVSNKGPGSAYDVAVRASSALPQVLIAGTGTIGTLAPGESKEVALQVTGNLDLPFTMAKLRIETSEKRGYGARPVLFELPTTQLVPPRLEIVDVTLNDQPSGRAHGDGDGQPANGETLEAIVRVRNAGPGEAVGVAVIMTAPKAVTEILEGKAIVPRIAANQVEEARLLFRLPLTLQASELPLSFHATEARGAQVATFDKEQTWKIRKKRPGIELAYRLYDGNSTRSVGNRDGLVNNGERIEVAVTPTNRGDLPARGVRVTIESTDPRLAPRPATLEVGDLPAQAEGAPQRFVFDLPRSYGGDRPEGDLHFTLNVAQRDFPPAREPVSLSFRPLRPELSLETVAPPALTRGTSSELVLQVRNNGTLGAEEVALDVTSKATGIDLLNEHGVPVSSLRIMLGALDQKAVAPVQRVRVNVRRNATIGVAPLQVTVSQKDFPAVVRSAALTVNDESAEVIAAAQPAAALQERTPAPVSDAPAMISFLRNTQGEHLVAEAIVLRFEVQSAVDLTEIRLTHNERRLSLEGARRTVSGASGLQVAQYEVPVQLEPGENRFEVVAVTRQGLRSARPLKLIRDHESGRLWVVAIGVSKYQDSTIPSLRYADADARAVYDYFRDTFGLPDSQIFLRVNAQATLREIKSVLGTQIVAHANDSRDTVVLYLAGHGMRDRVKGSLDADGLSKYFLPYDASRNDLYSTALDMDEVTNIIHRLTPERVVVLLDSCFSGAAGGRSLFDPATQGERAPITGEFLDRMTHAGKGRVVLTASGPDEPAQESADFAHGVFTYYLLEGLRGAADFGGDGEIDVHEIYRYVSERVARVTKGRQNPKLKEPDLVGRILLGRGAVRNRQ